MPRHDREDEDNDLENVVLQDFVFDMNAVPNPTILLVGKRFSGKSYTGASIADKFKHVPRWAAWVGTKDTGDYWAERFGSHASVRGPDEAGKAYLAELVEFQQKKSRLYKKVLKKPFPNKFELGLIFDDVTADRKFSRGGVLEDLFSNGRHYHTVIIISCQHIRQVTPTVRSNTDYIFMMHNTKSTVELLYRDYVEAPDEFSMFSQLLKAVTRQKDASGKSCHNSLVYDNAGTLNSRIDEIFKVYRPEKKEFIDTIELGSPEWRAYNQSHYRDHDYEQQSKEYNKRCKLQRLQQLRDSQASQRSMGQRQLDLDYLSDSDSDDDAMTSNSITLTSKRGSRMHVNIGQPPPSSSGMSVPNTSALGPGPYGQRLNNYTHDAAPLNPYNNASPLHPQQYGYPQNYQRPTNPYPTSYQRPPPPPPPQHIHDPTAFLNQHSRPAFGRLF